MNGTSTRQRWNDEKMLAVWLNDIEIAMARLKKVKIAVVRFYDPSALPTANTNRLGKGIRESSGTWHIYIYVSGRHGSSELILRGRQQRLSQMGSQYVCHTRHTYMHHLLLLLERLKYEE